MLVLLRYVDIEGFTSKSEVFLLGVETFPMIGLKMPE